MILDLQMEVLFRKPSWKNWAINLMLLDTTFFILVNQSYPPINVAASVGGFQLGVLRQISHISIF